MLPNKALHRDRGRILFSRDTAPLQRPPQVNFCVRRRKRRCELATTSTLLTISLLVEEDADAAARVAFPLRSEEEIRKAVLLAVAVLMGEARPDVQVEWSSSRSVPLDGKLWFGRCAVCHRWVFDCEAPSEFGAEGVSRGAKVDGRFRCDEHLPHGHPLCFAGRGYDGPVPDAEA
jgi:hypothetical protein